MKSDSVVKFGFWENDAANVADSAATVRGLRLPPAPTSPPAALPPPALPPPPPPPTTSFESTNGGLSIKTRGGRTFGSVAWAVCRSRYASSILSNVGEDADVYSLHSLTITAPRLTMKPSVDKSGSSGALTPMLLLKCLSCVPVSHRNAMVVREGGVVVRISLSAHTGLKK